MTLSLVNTEFSQLTGYSKKEIEGKLNWTEFFASDDLPYDEGIPRPSSDKSQMMLLETMKHGLLLEIRIIRTVYLTVALALSRD
jgi:PAS domain-containing protein